MSRRNSYLVGLTAVSLPPNLDSWPRWVLMVVGFLIGAARAAAIALTVVAIVVLQPSLFDGVYERLYLKENYTGQRLCTWKKTRAA
jgi:hypothetical protein